MVKASLLRQAATKIQIFRIFLFTNLLEHFLTVGTHEAILFTTFKADLRKQEFKCRHCDKIFSFSQSLHNHLRNDHETLESTFPCNICGKIFLTESNLKSHSDRVHLAITRDVLCQLCGKGVQTMMGLKRHLKRTHGVNEIKIPVVKLRDISVIL